MKIQSSLLFLYLASAVFANPNGIRRLSCSSNAGCSRYGSNYCCSQWGYCGTGSAYCGASGPSPTPPSSGTCGGGSVGDGVCSDGTCCSKWGYCGTTAEHCSGSGPVLGPTPPTPSPPGNKGINSPAITLTTSDVQAGLNKYGSQTATQNIVNQLNDKTRSYSLYRQLAFVAHTIWESGGYKYTKELAAINPPFSNRNAYQTCDWNTGERASNGKYFYGRGYLQLSWCANYKAYGRGRMINNDPDYFYNNPETVATTYAMDSAAWFFEDRVPDNTGQFGLTTKEINGPIECHSGNNHAGSKPQKRYQIFVALAAQVGLSGYSERGCYN